MMIRSALALMVIFATSSLMAASFDCTKATNFAEVSICKDGYLSTVDSSLASAYKKALANTEDPERLRQLQREWIIERNQCATQKCLDTTLGARVSFLNNYVNAEKNAAYNAEQKVRQEQRQAERRAEEIATAERTRQYNLAQEQARQQRQQQEQRQPQAQLAPATPVPSTATYTSVRPQTAATSNVAAEQSTTQKMWKAYWEGPAWKYTLVFAFMISCWTIWRHHTEAATIYNDYTDAAITNLLPAAGVVAALVLRWLELPRIVQGVAFSTGLILGIIYAIYATFRANRGALNIILVLLTKLTIISVFYAVIGMLIASLFSNSGRRKGESQARTAARHRREQKAIMALIATLSTAYTALTVWLCRNPEFTSISKCLEFDPTPQPA